MSSQKNNNLRTVWFYVALAICIVAMVVSIIVFTIAGKESNSLQASNNQLQNGGNSDNFVDDELNSGDANNGELVPNEPTISRITFIMPVSGEIINDYSDTPVFSTTLNRYSSHMAIDFSASEGASVYAVYAGTVSNVTNSITKGVTVTIDHGNDLYTVYNSLESIEDIQIGEVVKQGDVIGYVSTTNKQESADGPHLHFEVIESGNYVDPEKYLNLGEK